MARALRFAVGTSQRFQRTSLMNHWLTKRKTNPKDLGALHSKLARALMSYLTVVMVETAEPALASGINDPPIVF
ncbi:hypothetical protein PENANT_c039G02840 [Penicillium antarcticum]|uniref:Uncharacterized protein n=1 Tax=Penicillium antarcticum TaxID=416450 RepID=A0A1V6PUE7_9EURO|nr:hypothetical protein PENANT_c039G02840 [Penicillium antarcticum]